MYFPIFAQKMHFSIFAQSAILKSYKNNFQFLHKPNFPFLHNFSLMKSHEIKVQINVILNLGLHFQKCIFQFLHKNEFLNFSTKWILMFLHKKCSFIFCTKIPISHNFSLKRLKFNLICLLILTNLHFTKNTLSNFRTKNIFQFLHKMHFFHFCTTFFL